MRRIFRLLLACCVIVGNAYAADLPVSFETAAEQERYDTLLEELIGKNTAPRRLTVVSTDRQIRKVTRRRRATRERF